jgi:signal transduction histidine kinase
MAHVPYRLRLRGTVPGRPNSADHEVVLLAWLRKLLPRRGWRFAAVPLAAWLLLTSAGTTGVLCLQQHARDAAVQRFVARTGLMRDFVASYVADLLERERIQAGAFLTDETVNARDFVRSVGAFGYPAAVLLDQQGRVLQIVPRQPGLVGTDLTGRYAHLRTAVLDGRPAVSGVVPSAARGVPVAAFAVPFDTPYGRRVFSGAVDVGHSALSAYLTGAISLSGVRVQLVDNGGAVVAANRALDPAPTLAEHDRSLADALRTRPDGRFRRDGVWWRYTSRPIAGTPWHLSAAVSEPVLFASLTGSEVAGQVAVGTAAAVGLLVVAATAKARRNRRALQLSEQRLRIADEHRQQHVVELAERAEQLQRANAQVNDFMAMLSHDVRNPLTSIVTFGEVLLDDWAGMAEPDKQLYVQRMTAAGHRANGLVTEVLTLAQLDAGAIVARPVRLDIAHTVRETAAAHTAIDGQRIIVTAPDETIGLADPTHLQLIIGNLLGNAIKYGAPPVEITVANSGEHIRIEVRDAGEGVPEAFIPHLFNRFTRAGSGIATAKPGTGLGLYLAAQLAATGGLRLTYAPNTPHGARFILTLPRNTHQPPLGLAEPTTHSTHAAP